MSHDDLHESNSGATFLIGFIAGSMLGAGLALLFAPKPGDQTRREVAEHAQRVRDITGYAIGGIPPIGHSAPLTAYVDPDLLAFDIVWAAAGTPNAVFPVDPKKLAAAAGAETLDMGA